MYSDRIRGVAFSAHTSEEIRTLAVKRIVNPETYDQLLHPNSNGLYDLDLGPNDNDDRCGTCGMNSMKCPGHFGYIELPLPVYHPMFFKLMIQILSGSCFKCHRLTAKMSRIQLFIRQCELIDKGYFIEAVSLGDMYGFFVFEASEGIKSEASLQKAICDKIDAYYTDIEKQSDYRKVECTKNLTNFKQSLITEFIKVHLKSKTKECPHCKSLLRTIRSEYNVRVYFKSASHKAVQKAISQKMVTDLKGESKQRNSGDVHGIGTADDIIDCEEYQDAEGEIEDEDENPEQLKSKLSEQEYITPEEVKKHMIQLWNTDDKALKCLLGSFNDPERKKKVTTPEIFFLDAIAVPPSKFRPLSYMGEKRFENPQTANLNKILWFCKLINEILIQMKDNEIKDFAPVVITGNEKSYKAGNITVPGKSYSEQLQNAWIELQTDVNTFMDNSLSKLASSAIPGVKQLLEKKEGLFRKHMMGKRVNYACRSVISPDPYINTDEIGVPLIFAKKLTYVQPVTVWNLEQLTQMVINGPDKYPGAVMIEYEDGRKTKLSQNEVERRAVAKQLLSSSVGGGKIFQEKKVHRHLVDGDVLLLNRQPSLHKASIMAHKAKVLTNERTLRLHYANCKSYNADFDGDEMNAHFPQNELGRAEAYHLVSTNFNYLGPKDGKPLAGLIQDHIVAGVNMTARDCFFSREDYQQLVYSGLIDAPSYVKTLPPCIIKPVPLWSGKQVFSTLLLNVIPADKKPPSMNSGKVKISDGNWPKRKGRSNSENYHSAHSNDPFLTESQVIIREGQLLTGILDKTQYGAVPYSLVHSVYELYGGKISGKLLSVLSKVFTAYLQQHTGFTLGVEDIIVQPHAEAKRRELINEGRLCGDEAAMEALNVSCDGGELKEKLLEAHHSNHGIALQQLDLSMKSRTDSINNKVNSTCIKGLLKKFPSNSLQLMAISGAKGSSVNCMQISCLLGQIELEGRRPPLSMSGRSLPSFLPYDTSPRAGGFVDGRFLTGIQPQEYFFHCMAGREGLVDTAVKTSRSGYLQRCLMKHLESLLVQYDMTVRDGDGSVVQFLYGDDGMDVLKNQYMHKNQFKAIAQNYEAYVSLLKPSEVSHKVDIKKAPKMQRKCDRWKKRHNKTFSSKYSHNQIAPFFLFHQENCRSMKEQYPSLERHLGRTAADENLISNWIKSDGPSKENYITHCLPCPDPILSQLNPTSHFGAVSEKFMDDIKEYVKLNPDGLLTEDEDEEKVSSSTFLPLMLIKYMRSMVEPGEAVGVLAGQAIGEPSTQMTLNTFHFAGRGEVNVTLGIPRLREILMTASPNIKTPQMDVLVLSGEEKAAKRIAKKINRITLMDVLHHVSVSESLQRSYLDKVTRCRQFTIRLEFLPLHSYEHDYDVTPAKIMDYVETVFIRQITSYVSKIIRTKQKLELLNSRADDTHVVRSAEDGDVEEQSQIAPEEPDDEADLSDEDAGDGDIMNMKERNKQTQFTSYDDPDEQQKELDQDNEDNALLEEIHIKGEPMNYDDYEQRFSEGCDESGAIEKEEGKKGLKLDPRIANVLKRERHLTRYLVGDDNKWCEFTLQFPLAGSKVMLISVIEKLAEKAVVSEAAGIKKAVIIESKLPNETGRLRLKTEGANIPEFCNYDNIFDLNSLYCNNIHEVEKHYGIEAARAAIIKEVQDVFKVYGIQIDPRHLSLVADYMTFEGTYKPFNRHAIETNSSPFQKMSFETSMNFLRSATAFGQPDDLGSPSSRIVVGRVIGQGTGLMDLVPKLSV